jgi:hypothetical protein
MKSAIGMPLCLQSALCSPWLISTCNTPTLRHHRRRCLHRHRHRLLFAPFIFKIHSASNVVRITQQMKSHISRQRAGFQASCKAPLQKPRKNFLGITTSLRTAPRHGIVQAVLKNELGGERFELLLVAAQRWRRITAMNICSPMHFTSRVPRHPLLGGRQAAACKGA